MVMTSARMKIEIRGPVFLLLCIAYGVPDTGHQHFLFFTNRWSFPSNVCQAINVINPKKKIFFKATSADQQLISLKCSICCCCCPKKTDIIHACEEYFFPEWILRTRGLGVNCYDVILPHSKILQQSEKTKEFSIYIYNSFLRHPSSFMPKRDLMRSGNHDRMNDDLLSNMVGSSDSDICSPLKSPQARISEYQSDGDSHIPQV